MTISGPLSGPLDGVDRFTIARSAGFSDLNALTLAALSTHECGNCSLYQTSPGGGFGLFQIQQFDPKTGKSVWFSDPNNTQWGSFTDQTPVNGIPLGLLNQARAALTLFNQAGGDAPASGGGIKGFSPW